MGRQVPILGLRGDIAALTAFAERRGARAVPDLVPADHPPELESPFTVYCRRPGHTLFLVPRELAAVEIAALAASANSDRARVNVARSPVVELVPPRLPRSALRAGRLYIALSPSDVRFEELHRLYGALVRFVNKWSRTPRLDVRVGPEAADQVRAGLVIQSMIGEPLRLSKR